MRFATLCELQSDVNLNFKEKKISKHLVGRILLKYGIKSRIHAKKPYVSVKNRGYRLSWAKIMEE